MRHTYPLLSIIRAKTCNTLINKNNYHITRHKFTETNDFVNFSLAVAETGKEPPGD